MSVSGWAMWPPRWMTASPFTDRGQGPRRRSGRTFRAVWIPPWDHRRCCTFKALTEAGISPGTPTSSRKTKRQPRICAR
jgi:hypothetical protein